MSEARERRRHVNELLVETFNSILRVEENVVRNRLTEGLTISEVHAIHAIGLQGASPMNVIAARLEVTLATCTTSVGKLVDKGFAERMRSKADRRQVLVSLTKEGRQVYRVHELFHKEMVDAAFADLTEEEEDVLVRALTKVKAFFEEPDPSR
ncbi:MAG: MarR family transcriptional regulator [Slackia sp.]|nr:MarR family transcriptional regulator [Slackia sp.]